MITALIFAIHLIFLLIVFTIKWQSDGISSALMSSSLVIILFTVGWSLISALLKIIIDKEGFGLYFDRDTMSLTLLTFLEFFFYKFYLKDN